MTQNQILCVSYFDQVIGPNTFYSSENLSKSPDAPDINRILEFNDEEGTFIFAYRKYQTVNHIFYIESEIARGGQELIMITYMIKTAIFKDEIVDVFRYLDSKAPVLEEFAAEIRKLKELSLVLHSKKNSHSGENVLDLADEEFRNSFIDLFNKYFEKLTPKYKLDTPIKDKRQLKKIFIIGASRSGKTTFLKNLELIQFLNIKRNDLPSRVYEVIIENLEILKYDDSLSEFECKEFENLENCMNFSQGFILLFNLADESSILQTKEIFKIVDNTRLGLESDFAPILIIGNKFHDKEDFDENFINTTFEIHELRELGVKVKYFPINILKEDEKIMKAMRWLIRKII